MADRFLQSKTADTEASRSAMEQMAEGLRGDLGQVTAAHAGLYRQLNEQSEKLSTVAIDIRATRLSLEPLEARISTLETALASNRKLLVGALSLNAVTLIALLVLHFIR
jgi:septal ring factor EnvC (AmiA/AmiB activator)